MVTRFPANFARKDLLSVNHRVSDLVAQWPSMDTLEMLANLAKGWHDNATNWAHKAGPILVLDSRNI